MAGKTEIMLLMVGRTLKMLFRAGKWNKAFNGRKRRENAINGR